MVLSKIFLFIWVGFRSGSLTGKDSAVQGWRSSVLRVHKERWYRTIQIQIPHSCYGYHPLKYCHTFLLQMPPPFPPPSPLFERRCSGVLEFKQPAVPWTHLSKTNIYNSSICPALAVHLIWTKAALLKTSISSALHKRGGKENLPPDTAGRK